MKVTVCFAKTAIVVPCKDGKISVRELIQQAAQRYIKAKEKEPGYWVKIHHLEYIDGGILDPDDIAADVVEDKDKLIAVFDEHDVSSKADEGNSLTDHQGLDPFDTELAFQHPTFQPLQGEIEVTPSALRLGTPLLVRRSSDPAMGPVPDFHAGSSHTVDHSMKFAIQSPSTVSLDEHKEVNWQEHRMKSQKARFKFSALGLYIRGIEEHSRTKRDGLFQENECIVRINSLELADRSFTQAQDIFRQAMQHPSVLVEVVPSRNRELYEKAAISSFLDDEDDDEVPNIKPPPPPTQRKLSGKSNDHTNGLDSAMSLQSSAGPGLASSLPSAFYSPLNFGDKKSGKKMKIDLKKGADGLGFTVVTRDSTVHGPGPIFVKNILPKGAAIKDGCLLSGDQIMEVNGIPIAGKTQEELVAMLRSTKLGETVSLVVGRQEEAFLPRELKGEAESAVSPENTIQKVLEIPLNDSGSAGLGVSLKGNKSRDTNSDLGIFIKSIIHGGAAFKDGRLKVNDQLLAVNGENLLGKSNREAMETLRRSMSMEGNIRGMIQLVILRKLDKQTEGRLETGIQLQNTQENVSQQNGLQDKKMVLAINDQSLEEDIPPPLPPHPKEHILVEHSKSSSTAEISQHLDTKNIKASKSMDLVADESNISSLNARTSDYTGKDLGPRLGLKMSSSLESLQTAVAEVKKNELPFYRPRPHMVRGRGCNESFRTAIDKSYDKPETEEDGLSDVSSHSGRASPNSELVPQENVELVDIDKTKKDKKKKDKKKEKEKTKTKEKKRKEEIDDQEKKAKKKGFGAMLRYGHTYPCFTCWLKYIPLSC
ncbi:partitioning defective 3 homolog B isoform X2 [Hyperolius riggenbachi]|uniref:partitioning defective 3 homolog B isoform X2 n=1 Tax=Hyperolius riggenbachi TaxID=752182 RepID=UPI0035A32B4E